MDFRKREVDFQEADRRYADLARQRDAGRISDEEFNTQRQQLMVQDDEGCWWLKYGESGEWHYRDGNTWVRGIPPRYQEPRTKLEGSREAQTPSLPRSRGAENRETKRLKMPFWIPVAGLGGIALVGIVLILWVLLPYLREVAPPGEQGEPLQSKQGGSVSGGGAFDATFIHRATSENISANSTYLDHPVTNENPDVLLYVTQNWNPEGGAGTYNSHPIGIWYDSSRQQWAIFNQDRETIPDGAAFNVAALEGPTEEK